MARCEFTAQAVEDLREIGRYTRQQWGVAQARHYRRELQLRLEKLSLSARVGVAREELGPGVRSFPVASHVAYYLVSKGGITVLRLLHPSMEVERVLAKE
jgi:toxin ParE1/3/4